MTLPGGNKILVIDDDHVMHDLARAHLKNSGYQISSAYDGVSGLQLLLQERPDLVLLDYMMPHMNGEAVFLEMTRNEKYREVRETPVIMLTARDAREHLKTEMLERGVSAYLQKPFGLRELTNVIENVNIIHDIRRRNQQLTTEVRVTREHLEVLTRNAPLGIFSTDAHGRIRHINKVLAQLLGYNNEDILLDRVIADTPGLQETFLSTAVARVLTGKTPWQMRNLRFIRAQEHGRILNVHCVPLPNPEGEMEGVAGFVEDVTETEKRNAQLQMLSTVGLALQRAIGLDDLLHLILTAITAGPALGFTRAIVFLLDRNRRYLIGKMGVGPANEEEAHRTWENLAREHITLEDFLEKYGKARPATPTKFDEKVRHQYFALAAKGSIFLQEITQRRPFRGQPEHLDQSACRNVFNALDLRDFVAMPLVAKDRLVGLIIADNLYRNMPITAEQVSLLELFASQAAQAIEKAGAYHRLEMEKRKLEHAYQELQHTHKRLLHSERLATIGNMAAHVAHEIRNPLVTIGGFTRSLQRQLHNPEAVRNTLNIISDEVVRLEKILADVLEFTRLPASIRQDIDLNQIVAEVCTLLQNEAENHHIRVVRTLDADVKPMRLDAVQIKQLLMNLMQNAIQAMANGGELEVRTEFLETQRVRLSVRDTGCGIEPEVLEKIFTPFFTTKSHGTGLGLAICRQIVNEHSGEISVNSTPQQGTTFFVDLPTQQKNVATQKTFDISDKVPGLRLRSKPPTV